MHIIYAIIYAQVLKVAYIVHYTIIALI